MTYGSVYVFKYQAVCLYRTRSVTREEKNLSNFLKRPVDKWVENSFEV